MKRRTRGAALVAAAWLAACSKPDDAVLIDRAVDRAIAAAEERDVGGLVALVSERYKDSRGNDKPTLKSFLAGQFFRRGALHAVKLGHTIRLVPPDGATSQLRLFLAAGEGAIPNERDAVVFDLTWRKEDGGWRVVSAEDRRMKTGDLLGL